MEFTHYSDDTALLAESLVNTFDSASGEEKLRSVADLAEFVAEHATPWAGPLPAADSSALDAVRTLRSSLRAAFEAGSDLEAASILNSILSENDARPRVSAHGGEPHLHFEPADADLARWLAVVTGMGLATVLVDGGIGRFGICQSETCDDVFVDTSRNRSRRHCSTTCTTRVNVAAHRRRLRGGQETGSA